MFDDRLVDMQRTHAKKQADYGTDQDEYANYTSSEEFGIPAWLNAVLRVREKLNRVATFVNKGELQNESIEDALRDIATGGAIAWDLYLSAEETTSATEGARGGTGSGGEVRVGGTFDRT